VQQIWAPWRMAYLEGDDKGAGCFLCDVGAGSDDAGIVVWRGQLVYALLNAYPYANGHVMVVPYVHEGQLDRLAEAAAVELLAAVRLVIRALRAVYEPEGFNVGANLGAAAGAGCGDHLHIHVVPRWDRDTNFMTTTAGTRVIPETLEDTARRVRAALASLTPIEEAHP
jgi:ATP adenylyltransferase